MRTGGTILLRKDELMKKHAVLRRNIGTILKRNNWPMKERALLKRKGWKKSLIWTYDNEGKNLNLVWLTKWEPYGSNVVIELHIMDPYRLAHVGQVPSPISKSMLVPYVLPI